MSHSNLHIIELFFDAYGKKDMNAIKNVMDINVSWTFNGSHPLSGTKKGIDNVIAFFDKMENIMGRSNVTSEKMVTGESDTHVIECQHVFTDRDDGKNIDHHICILWNFKDGKIISGTHFFADPESVNWFFNAVIK